MFQSTIIFLDNSFHNYEMNLFVLLKLKNNYIFFFIVVVSTIVSCSVSP